MGKFELNKNQSDKSFSFKLVHFCFTHNRYRTWDCILNPPERLHLKATPAQCSLSIRCQYWFLQVHRSPRLAPANLATTIFNVLLLRSDAKNTFCKCLLNKIHCWYWDPIFLPWLAIEPTNRQVDRGRLIADHNPDWCDFCIHYTFFDKVWETWFRVRRVKTCGS